MWPSASQRNNFNTTAAGTSSSSSSTRRSSIPPSDMSSSSSTTTSSALPPLRGATSALNLNNNNSALANAMNQLQQQQNQSPQSSSSSQNNNNNNNNQNSSSRHVEADTITALRSKMEKQRVELDLRTDNVNAIQRNFQRLSEMYAADRQRLQDLEKNSRAMAIENESLRAEQKLFRALQQEFNGLKTQLSQQEDSYTRQVRAKENEIVDLREKLRTSLETEKSLMDALQKAQGASDRDAGAKEKLFLTIGLCEKSLLEAISQVSEEDKLFAS